MSEVAKLPKEWSLVPLSQLMKFQNGFNTDKAAYGRGLRFANVLEVITNTHLSAHMIPGRVATSAAETTRYLVQRGDVLFNRTSETQEEVGLASVYLDDEPILFGGFVLRGKPISDILDPVFAGYGLRSMIVRQQIMAAGQGGIRANISQQSLAEIKIALPGKLEQEVIAEALSDADALIDGLERLVAKKRLIKQGVMQDVLTAKRRLPGFSGEWAKVTLGEIGSFVGGGTPSMARKDFWEDGTVPWVSSSDVRVGELHRAERMITVSAVKGSSTRVVEPGSILFVTRSGILRRFQPVMINTVPVAINQDIKALLPRNSVYSSSYIFHAAVAAGDRILRDCMKTGTTVESIDLNALRRFQIDCPKDRNEQDAIARVLSDMGAEIQALEGRLEKARQVKEGMMQNLLTGRIRLV